MLKVFKKKLYEIRHCGKFLCYINAVNKYQAMDKANSIYGKDKILSAQLA